MKGQRLVCNAHRIKGLVFVLVKEKGLYIMCSQGLKHGILCCSSPMHCLEGR